MDYMHDTHMTPDSSPVVSMLMIVCASMYIFFQNTLSSPLKLWLSCVSEEQLMASGNIIYLQSQFVIEHQRQKITEMENQIQMLEMDIVVWKTQHTSTQ